MVSKIKYLLLILALLLGGYVSAFEAEEKLSDPRLEKQAQDMFKEVRCVVCTGQALAESDADIAKDLRKIIRKKLRDGQKEQEIKNYLVDRYGSEILLRPEFNKNTISLWLLPLLIVAIGFTVIFKNSRRS